MAEAAAAKESHKPPPADNTELDKRLNDENDLLSPPGPREDSPNAYAKGGIVKGAKHFQTKVIG